MTDKRLPRQGGTDGNDDPPAIWVGYGKLLKLHRKRAGLNQEQLAEAMVYSLHQIASVEQGRRPAKLHFTETAERVLDAGGNLLALQEQVDLARLPVFFRDFAALEADAISFFWYGGYVVPGLPQTEDYARALLSAHFPPLGEEVVEQRVEARMERQSSLSRKNPPLVATFVIEEVVLRRPVGGSAVMKAQLRKLLEQAQLPNVQVQVMPTSFGAHSGLNGSMVLLETTEHRRVAYTESQDISSTVHEARKVGDFWLRYGMLRSQALNLEEPARLIECAAGEL
ncbi:helix-turn-helix transcriptional regulator [Streptomyces sp. TRM 70361]|uniref:helix-turn-helix domain-containing protein n=1 Tax=Streptomyces sp. TRM 70361 TaxID=3116553 RepID=UPI002E7BBC35|nr:helix-turn-helix transcriptional regulator [Streptomyces sp. TRM 70361]MEE1942902.1 helix-turn-helix transcriptional regulator [Streptomyces sp. TRM 70361]